MLDKIYRFLPLLISLTISNLVYLKTDKKYKITDKISSKLPIHPNWQEAFCICCNLLILLFLGLIYIYIIDISPNVYYIICGIITGIGIGICSNISARKNLLNK